MFFGNKTSRTEEHAQELSSPSWACTGSGYTEGPFSVVQTMETTTVTQYLTLVWLGESRLHGTELFVYCMAQRTLTRLQCCTSVPLWLEFRQHKMGNVVKEMMVLQNIIVANSRKLGGSIQDNGNSIPGEWVRSRRGWRY